MRVADLVKISLPTMEMLSKHDIKMSDCKYVNLYADYEELVGNGSKISYVVAVLAEKYNMSETSVYRLLRKFKRTI